MQFLPYPLARSGSLKVSRLSRRVAVDCQGRLGADAEKKAEGMTAAEARGYIRALAHALARGRVEEISAAHRLDVALQDQVVRGAVDALVELTCGSFRGETAQRVGRDAA